MNYDMYIFKQRTLKLNNEFEEVYSEFCEKFGGLNIDQNSLRWFFTQGFFFAQHLIDKDDL